MRKAILLLTMLVAIAIDLVSKDAIENDLFGTSKYICQRPDLNSFASAEYCQNNTITLNSYLAIKLSYNSGVAFSLPIRGIFLQILTIVLIAGLAYSYISQEYKKNSRLLDIGYVLALSGALSHAYERIFIGHVVDFIALKYFAIFNFADIFISIGAFLIIIFYVRNGSPQR